MKKKQFKKIFLINVIYKKIYICKFFTIVPESWTVYEVGSWLALMEFTEYRINFIENNIR